MPDLTKWPLLLVTGEPVTEQQANEILIRTDRWTLSTNDRDWEAQICQLLNVKQTEHGRPDWAALDALRTELGVLPLHYLTNERIVSSWIGGPHGWCDWDGTIATSNYNIGKWPDREEVTADWETIARVFPFLNLRAQLVADEGDASAAAVEWHVHDGRVEVIATPARLLRRPTDPEWMTVFQPGGERGVSLNRFAVAVAQVRASRQDTP